MRERAHAPHHHTEFKGGYKYIERCVSALRQSMLNVIEPDEGNTGQTKLPILRIYKIRI